MIAIADEIYLTDFVQLYWGGAASLCHQLIDALPAVLETGLSGAEGAGEIPAATHAAHDVILGNFL